MGRPLDDRAHRRAQGGGAAQVQQGVLHHPAELLEHQLAAFTGEVARPPGVEGEHRAGHPEVVGERHRGDRPQSQLAGHAVPGRGGRVPVEGVGPLDGAAAPGPPGRSESVTWREVGGDRGGPRAGDLVDEGLHVLALTDLEGEPPLAVGTSEESRHQTVEAGDHPQHPAREVGDGARLCGHLGDPAQHPALGGVEVAEASQGAPEVPHQPFVDREVGRGPVLLDEPVEAPEHLGHVRAHRIDVPLDLHPAHGVDQADLAAARSQHVCLQVRAQQPVEVADLGELEPLDVRVVQPGDDLGRAGPGAERGVEVVDVGAEVGQDQGTDVSEQ